MRSRFLTATIIALSLSACSSTNTYHGGLSPTERVEAAQNRTLSHEPGSSVGNLKTSEGGVGISVAEF